MTDDNEIDLMQAIFQHFTSLKEPAAQRRVMGYMAERLGLNAEGGKLEQMYMLLHEACEVDYTTAEDFTAWFVAWQSKVRKLLGGHDNNA